ncbi:ATP synthase subunit b [Acaryochloris thomasi RCC1774]|uniref:ATP synthase subunit b n=1 Tax=Acaryochloris thomasi RCC1774 TaxID=1764569 RepID=A0A2W1JA80_9CYAN|nr:ATP F0F1 synthase subunit B [Acaryochloris thomasi]PZD70918.1 ATP synthase subunit b [Acaryochloris thomasi RCC1774]
MLIDPLTTFAQIINFLILVALLKRFLYVPITRVMKQREHRIAMQLQEAAAKEEMAQQEAERYRQMQRDLEAQQAQFLAQAQLDADEHRQMLLQNAREDVDSIHATWTAAVECEKQVFLGALRQRAGQQVATTVRGVLRDLANTNLELQIVEAFIVHLSHLTVQEQETLEAALSTSNAQELVIQSTFPISAVDQARVLEALYVQTTTLVGLGMGQFVIVPDLMCGIELKIPGYKLAWNLAHYLERLEENLARVLDSTALAEDG